VSYTAWLVAANAISYLIGLVCPILEYRRCQVVVVTVHEHFNSDGEFIEGGEGVSVVVGFGIGLADS